MIIPYLWNINFNRKMRHCLTMASLDMEERTCYQIVVEIYKSSPIVGVETKLYPILKLIIINNMF